MKVALIEASDHAGWAKALEGVPHAIAHTPAYAMLMDRAAGTQTWLFTAEGAGGKAVCPITERRYQGALDVFTPYGFGGFAGVGDLSGLPEAWSEFAVERHYVASYLMQNPFVLPSQLKSFWPDMCQDSRTAFGVDLTAGEAERLRQVSSRKRPQLKRWLESAEAETDQKDLADAFRRLYPAFVERKRTSETYRFSDDVLEALVDLPQTFLVGCRNAAGSIACVALMGATQACGDYLFMASEAGAEGDGSGVLWLGLRELASRGVPMCNLGGGISEGDGVAEFKRRLGGKPASIPVIKEVFDAGRYGELCRLAGCSPENSDFFPAYYQR